MLVYIVIAYVLFMFVLVRLVVPYIGFWREQIPEKLPPGLLKTVRALKVKNRSPEKLARAVHAFLAKKYYGSHILTFVRPDLVLSRNIARIWRISGYLPCNQQNWLLYIMLVQSGFFSPEDVRFRITTVVGFIHQYVQVKLNKKWVSVDVWASRYGVDFGKRSGLFGAKVI